jgi:amino acid adenylation domain-containing protein
MTLMLAQITRPQSPLREPIGGFGAGNGCDGMTARSWGDISQVRVPRQPAGFVEFRHEEIEQTIPARFERQVVRFPDRIAVTARGRLLTYRALNQAANRVARMILAERGTAAEPVVLLVDHPAAAVTGALGILKAGKAIVPVDASHPAARVAGIVEQSGAGAVVVDSPTLRTAQALPCRPPQAINVDAADEAVSTENIGLPIPPSAIDRIVYTSGSSGRPKGVFQTHRASMHTIMLFTNSACVCPDDRLMLLLSHTHGAGLNSIFTALLNGARVVPFDVRRDGFAEMTDVMAREAITIYYSVPTVFRTFGESLRAGTRFPSLRLIELSGEPVTRHDVDLYRAIAPDQCVLCNHLGSSEAGFHRWYFIAKDTEIAGGVVPAGYPVPTVTIAVLDDAGREVPAGEIGEISVQSRYLECGYWNDPELTGAVFQPAAGRDGERIYMTGDLGRLLSDGRLLCLGRKDSQVKIRGHRVEPAEVEAALRGHPAVADAAVMGRPDPGSGEMRLVAYVVTREAPPALTELRNAVAASLPHHMVPASFVFIEALPTLPNGKVDHRALPALVGGAGREPKDGEPLPALARQIAEMWKCVLGIQQVGLRDNFFDLGGDSLSAARIFRRIEQVWDRRLRFSTFLLDATVERLTEMLGDVHPLAASEGFEPPVADLSDLLELPEDKDSRDAS